jgi:hypothetical protein
MTYVAAAAMITAAETAAAIAAAEAAAITAAEIAAAEAAAALAAEQVAAQTAAQAATQVATETAAQQGITQAAVPGLEQVATPGLEQVGTQGINSVAPGGQPMIDPNSGLPMQIQQPVINQAEVDQMTRIMADNAGSNQVYKPVGQGYAQAPTSDVGAVPQTLNQPPASVTPNTANLNITGTSVQPGYLTNPNTAPTNSMLYPGQGAANSTIGTNSGVSAVSPGSGIKSGWEAATEWMGKNPMLTGMGIYAGLNATGAFKPQDTSFGPETYTGGNLANYRLAPNFQTYPSGPNTNIYRPKYAAAGGIMQVGGPVERMSDMNQLNMNNPNYPMAPAQMANGGITSFARGGASYNPGMMDYYAKMLDQSSAMPAPSKGDAGVFVDSNPNTRRLLAADAAQYNESALNNRYGIHTPTNIPKSSSINKFNTVPVIAKQKKRAADDVEAAAGGIMQAQRYNLGGYASGGNPRLLRGPGDGMSDNIPATIEDTQPARLADGEFVVPADVVSGLGNGSTEAGAKHLHKMMDKVRVARTGKKAQGKQINPSKYMPK